MKKIFSNMRPYWRIILVILLLIVVQAACDLSLPQFTSDIIDIGIQNKGVSHVLPEKMTAETFEQTKLFMTEDEKELFANAYKEEDSLYVRTEKTEEELDELDEALMTPIALTYQISNMSKEDMEAAMKSEAEKNPENAEMIAQMGQMPPEEIGKMMREQLSKMTDSIGENTIKGMGVAYAVSCDKAAGVDVDKIQMNYMVKTGAKMLGMALLMLAASIGVGYFASKVGAGVGRDLRQSVFHRVVSFSNSEMDRFSTASLITRSTNDIQQIQMTTSMLLRMILYAPILGLGGIYKVAHTGANMEWIIVLAVALILALVGVLLAITMPKFKSMQKLVDRVNLVSREILTGLSVIRAFRREEREEERFDEANKDLMKTQLFTNRMMTAMMPGMMLVMYGITLLIVWVSAHRIDNGVLQVGTMTAFITYSMQIVMSFLMLTMMSIMLPRAGVAADRIDEVIKTEPSITEIENPKKQTSHDGKLVFSHVNFRYPNAKEDVLSDIDFTAEKGKTTAIIGSTGCGKSTLVNLIPRFYDITGGKITLDGVDIRELSLKELRDEIGFVPQKGVLFSGTIASNLRFGNSNASDELVKEAAEIAQASDFIEEKHDKYDSQIAQGGSNVSGGQKQRLAIARAIAKEPKIFVFDDSFSALDMKTDAALRKALESKTGDSTVIIVAQRISTILHADQILVLDDGKIVGRGTHEELLNNCETYRQIATSQLSAKELGIEEGKEE